MLVGPTSLVNNSSNYSKHNNNCATLVSCNAQWFSVNFWKPYLMRNCKILLDKGNVKSLLIGSNSWDTLTADATEFTKRSKEFQMLKDDLKCKYELACSVDFFPCKYITFHIHYNLAWSADIFYLIILFANFFFFIS